MLPQSTPQTLNKRSDRDQRLSGEDPALSFAELRDQLKASADLPEATARVDCERAFQRLFALPSAEHTRDSIEALIELAKNLYLAAQPDKAVQAASHAAQMAKTQDEHVLLCAARGIEGLLLSDLGRFGEAMTAQLEALSLARQLGDKRREILAINGIGTVCMGIGQWHVAIQYVMRARDLAEETGSADNAIAAQGNIAECAVHLREPALGLRALANVDTWTPRTRIEFSFAANAHNTLARLHLMTGEIDAARLHAKEGARLARIPNGEKWIRANEAVVGLIDISSGEVEKGLAAVERSLAFSRHYSQIDLADYLGICIDAYEAAGHSDIALVYLHELVAWKKNAFSAAEAPFQYAGLIEATHLHTGAPGSDDGLVAKAHALQSSVQERLGRLVETAINAEMVGRHDLYRTFRLAKLARMFAVAKSWSEHRVGELRLGAQLCNIGMISVPARVLQKPRGLSAGERHVLRDHTRYGAQLLTDSKLRVLGMASVIAEQHHERYDGSGYPRGLSGNAIAEEARLVSVCDAFDAMMHPRPWRPVPFSIQAALNEIERGAGTQFDPNLACFFVELIRREFWKHDDWDRYLAEDADDSEYVRARARIEAFIGAAK